MNAICTGGIDLKDTRQAMDSERAAKLESQTPLGRLGQPEYVAPFATYVASAESANVTSAVIVADGGRTAR